MPYSTYLPEHMGTITLSPAGPFVAGSYQELTLVYTAGTFGIDDTGMAKISWRTTSDMSRPQFDKPQAANYTTVEASNCGFDMSDVVRHEIFNMPVSSMPNVPAV